MTFAKVFRGPFTPADIHAMNPHKYPPGCRNVRDTLGHLRKLGFIESLGSDKFQITKDGVNAVYWFGGHFVRNARDFQD